MLASVLMGQNGHSFCIQPLIAVRVIEMPGGVDQMSDRSAAEAVGGVQDSRTGWGDSGIDERLAIGTGQDSDIAARALENADVAAQPVDLDGRLGGGATDQIHDIACFGVGLRGAQPAACGCKRGGGHAAEAERATWKGWLMQGGTRIRLA